MMYNYAKYTKGKWVVMTLLPTIAYSTATLLKLVNKNDPMKPDFIYYLAMWADDCITDVYICNHGHIH